MIAKNVDFIEEWKASHKVVAKKKVPDVFENVKISYSKEKPLFRVFDVVDEIIDGEDDESDFDEEVDEETDYEDCVESEEDVEALAGVFHED